MCAMRRLAPCSRVRISPTGSVYNCDSFGKHSRDHEARQVVVTDDLGHRRITLQDRQVACVGPEKQPLIAFSGPHLFVLGQVPVAHEHPLGSRLGAVRRVG